MLLLKSVLRQRALELDKHVSKRAIFAIHCTIYNFTVIAIISSNRQKKEKSNSQTDQTGKYA